jgi:hypothetical protein
MNKIEKNNVYAVASSTFLSISLYMLMQSLFDDDDDSITKKALRSMISDLSPLANVKNSIDILNNPFFPTAYIKDVATIFVNYISNPTEQDSGERLYKGLSRKIGILGSSDRVGQYFKEDSE